VFLIPISSATLANPRQLESILLSRNPGQVANTGAGYAAVYGTVPIPANAPPAALKNFLYPGEMFPGGSPAPLW